MDIIVRVLGNHPLDILGYAMSGFHRPLFGESANLTITCDHEHFFPEWLAAPPLGAECAVDADGNEIMTGVLYGVRITASAVELKVEG